MSLQVTCPSCKSKVPIDEYQKHRWEAHQLMSPHRASEILQGFRTTLALTEEENKAFEVATQNLKANHELPRI